MATKKTKQTKTDRELSAALKSARQKVYRLKKAGASAEELARIDPRRSLYGDMKRDGRLTNGAQKRAYIKQLREFASRDNRYIVTLDGSVIESADVARYTSAERKANDAKRAVQKRMRKLGGPTPKIYNSSFPEGVPVKDLSSAQIRVNYYRDYATSRHRAPFSSREAFERAIKAQNAAYDEAVYYDQRLQNFRMSLINRLHENFQDELAEAIRSMSDAQFEFATVYTDINEMSLTLHYKSKMLDEGRAINEDVFDNSRRGIESAIRIAKQHGPKGKSNALESYSLEGYTPKSQRPDMPRRPRRARR